MAIGSGIKMSQLRTRRVGLVLVVGLRDTQIHQIINGAKRWKQGRQKMDNHMVWLAWAALPWAAWGAFEIWWMLHGN